jgi:hypothetical protein
MLQMRYFSGAGGSCLPQESKTEKADSTLKGLPFKYLDNLCR